MPTPTRSHKPEYSRSLEQCNAELYTLFAELKDFDTSLKQVHQFYKDILDKSPNDEEDQRIVRGYKNLVNLLNKTKLGELSAEMALIEIDQALLQSKCEVIVENLFKTCEFLFWAVATAACFVGCFAVGVPLMVLDPLIGLAITIATGAMLINTANKALNCCDQFKDFGTIDKEHEKTKQLVSFFKPPATPKASQNEQEELVADELSASI
jgi:uncharacterized membrane protein